MVSTPSDLLSHVPVMRRFAGLLVGSTEGGDQLVADALARSASGDRDLDEGELRLMLLGRVIDAFAAWRAASAPDGAGGAGSSVGRAVDGSATTPLMAAIHGLPPTEQIPLLLVSVLDVETEDVAMLLDTTEQDVRSRVAKARQLILSPGPAASHRGVLHERATSRF